MQRAKGRLRRESRVIAIAAVDAAAARAGGGGEGGGGGLLNKTIMDERCTSTVPYTLSMNGSHEGKTKKEVDCARLAGVRKSPFARKAEDMARAAQQKKKSMDRQSLSTMSDGRKYDNVSKASNVGDSASDLAILALQRAKRSGIVSPALTNCDGETKNNGISLNDDSKIDNKGNDQHDINLKYEMENLLEGLAMGLAADMNSNNHSHGNENGHGTYQKDCDRTRKGPAEAFPPHNTLSVNLLKHQRVALAWMLKREGVNSMPRGGILADDQGLGKTVTTLALIVSSPAWYEPVESFSTTHEYSGTRQPMRSMLKEHTTSFNGNGTRKEKNNHNVEAMQNFQNRVDKKKNMTSSRLVKKMRGGTLVVCPTAVLYQWASELRNKVGFHLGLKVLIHHGASRPASAETLASYDIVLTTYALVAIEVSSDSVDCRKDIKTNNDYNELQSSKSKNGPLGHIHWWRVILDEAQSMKNARTRIACSCSALVAQRRWCLTGTPMQNSIDDMYSYFRYLKYSPYENLSSFKSMIAQPVQKGKTDGWTRLRTILRSIMLRRTKSSQINGEPLVKLPPRIINTQRLKFTSSERIEYDVLLDQFKKQFETFKEEGSVSRNYVNILWMLLRLRQACNDPKLPTMRMMSTRVNDAEDTNVSKEAIEAIMQIPEETRRKLLNKCDEMANLCPICRDVPEEAVVAICGHIFCKQCAFEHITNSDVSDGESYLCEQCQTHLTSCDIHSPTALRKSLTMGGNEEANVSSVAGIRKRPVTSTKVAAVLAKLREIHPYKVIAECDDRNSKRLKSTSQKKHSGSSDAALAKALPPLAPPPPNPNHTFMNASTQEKVIIFSQWTAMLDLLEDPLRSEGYVFRRLDGTMSVSVRQQALKDFSERSEVKVMLMSLKAASLGLNMVCANHVFLLDLWWCPTTEDQAIDRCHRIGQRRPVNVTRFIIEDSVEERILKIQERKRELVASAFEWNEKTQVAVDLSLSELVSLFANR